MLVKYLPGKRKEFESTLVDLKNSNPDIYKNYQDFRKEVAQAGHYGHLINEKYTSRNFEALNYNSRDVWSARLNKKYRIEFTFDEEFLTKLTTTNQLINDAKELVFLKIHPHKYEK